MNRMIFALFLVVGMVCHSVESENTVGYEITTLTNGVNLVEYPFSNIGTNKHLTLNDVFNSDTGNFTHGTSMCDSDVSAKWNRETRKFEYVSFLDSLTWIWTDVERMEASDALVGSGDILLIMRRDEEPTEFIMYGEVEEKDGGDK